MLDNGQAESEEQLRDFNRTVVSLGEELGIPVVATGDVHFLDPEDEVYRHLLLAANKFQDADRPLPLYFKTTDEMLEEFSYLGQEKAYEIVVKNPNLIADMCETLRPVPHGLFAPAIENSVGQLKDLVYGKLHRLYGDHPPELIQKRVDQEMHDIITCHYDVIYMSAQKLSLIHILPLSSICGPMARQSWRSICTAQCRPWKISSAFARHSAWRREMPRMASNSMPRLKSCGKACFSRWNRWLPGQRPRRRKRTLPSSSKMCIRDSHHPAQRRNQNFKFPVMAVGLCRILFYGHPLAGLHPGGTGEGHRVLPGSFAPIWRNLT